MKLLGYAHFALRCIALFGILIVGVPSARAAAEVVSDVDVQLVREATARARLHWLDIQDPARVVDGAACVRELHPFYATAVQLAEPGADYFAVYAHCRFLDPLSKKTPLTEMELRQWYAPRLESQYNLSERASDPILQTRAITAEMNYLRLGQELGLADEAESRFHKLLKPRMALAVAEPPDARANAEMLTVARLLFGAWQIQAQVLRTQQLLEDGLGVGHRASLMLLRAAAYHERYMGRQDQALRYISRAASLSKLHHPTDELLQAHMATEWAACLAGAGRQAEAIPKMLQARDFFEAQLPMQWTNIVRTNYNLAGTALDMGDYTAAIQYSDRAIDYIKRSNDPTLLNYEIMVPAAIAEIAKMSLGDATAPARLKAALQINPYPEMHIGSQAFALVRDSVRRGDKEMLEWAVGFTDLHIRRFRAPLQAESALRPLMQAWRDGGSALNESRVREPLERSLTIALGGRSPSTAALVHFNMARYFAGPSPETAIWLYKRAANTLQQLRKGLPTDDQDLYRSWLSNYEDELRHFVSLLIDEGRLPEAEQVLRLLREEELHEYSRRSSARRNSADTALSFTNDEQVRNNVIAPLIVEAEASAQAAHARLDALRLTDVRTDYRDAVAEESTQALQARLHTLLEDTHPRAVKTSAPDLARDQSAAALPSRSARLTYVVGKDSLDVIVRLRHGSFRHRVAVKASDLNQQIETARGALSSEQIDPSVPLQRLWEWLIKPLLPKLLSARVQNLFLVPDGALRYLPFASLYDGKRYLVERFTLQTQLMGGRRETSPSVLKPRESSVLAVGRTIGDTQHSALPGVARELSSIRMPQSLVLMDSDFTSAGLKDGLQRKPGIVHVASHFVLDPSGEDKSYLLLGDGQRLSLTELRAMPWDGVRLALLSACDSAISVGHGDGREWVGFAQSLGTAGVKDVLATLWRIDDTSTARWMTDFYSRLRVHGNPRVNSATLAAVQRKWLSRYQGSNRSHPHYWAAFVWLAT